MASAWCLADHPGPGDDPRGPVPDPGARKPDGPFHNSVKSNLHPRVRPWLDTRGPTQDHWDLVTFSSGGSIQFFLGVDGLNIWMVALTAVLMLPSVLVSWTHVTERVNEFFAWLLAFRPP